MSWYRDPQLFISSSDKSSFWVYRITKESSSSPIGPADFNYGGRLVFSEHLSLGNNKESDYDAFKATFSFPMNCVKYINSQGFVINWDDSKRTSYWSREDTNSPFWSLPGIGQALQGRVSDLKVKIISLEEENKRIEKEKEAIEAEKYILKAELSRESKLSALEAKISSLQNEVRERDEKILSGLEAIEKLVSNSTTKQKSVTELLAENKALAVENSELKAKIASLRDEVDNNKVEKEEMNIRVLDVEAENSRLKAEAEKSALERKDMLSGLEKQVADLTLKLAQCCGGGSPTEEPWITDQAVPSNWVAFEELCVLEYSQNIPLIVTKATGGLKLGDDKTTNVQANCFYRGKFPIMVVDVAELTPNREEARFDPCIWGSYTHAGNTYAARKLFASEMSGDAHKTC